MTVRLMTEQIEQIVSYGEQGKIGQWVARKMDIHPATVCYQMLRAGIDPWKTTHRTKNYKHRGAFTEVDDARLLELAKTMPVYRVAKEMGRRCIRSSGLGRQRRGIQSRRSRLI